MKQDQYAEPKIFTYPGAVAKVYSPVLTDAERQARMARISESAKRLLTSKSN